MPSLHFALFAGAVAALPSNLFGRVILNEGNPYKTCQENPCAAGVIAAGRPTPNEALLECSAFFATEVTSTKTSTSTVTTNPPPVTVTSTQTLPTNTVSNVRTTNTVTTTVEVTDYQEVISYFTYYEGNVVEIDATETFTEVETKTVTSTQIFAPQGAKKRDVRKGPKPKRGACRHHPESTTLPSASITTSTNSSGLASSTETSTTTSDPASTTLISSSTDLTSSTEASDNSADPASTTEASTITSNSASSTPASLPAFCSDVGLYFSACSCAYVTGMPIRTVSTVILVTETILSTDTVFATAYSGVTQTATITAFVTTEVEVTIATETDTYVDDVLVEFTDYDYETSTVTIPSLTTKTVVVTMTPTLTVN
ncbi:hypothetical protein PG993_011322 [Apiospora rasikravindrae]|uniref:Uncharacterized protein n=1 Tax=Apiospora rasikravindrae TaxID=990691 RepID=A0ABR1SE68_9PEZI